MGSLSVHACCATVLGWQIAIGTDDVYKVGEQVKAAGGKITREAGPLPGIGTKIMACLDPDGWKTVRDSLLNAAMPDFAAVGAGRFTPNMQCFPCSLICENAGFC